MARVSLFFITSYVMYDFFLDFFDFFSDFFFHLNAREYRKFGNPEREYRIPEIPVP